MTMQKAILDRIEDGTFAVLLVGEEEVEYTVSLDQLPSGINEGDHLLLIIGLNKR